MPWAPDSEFHYLTEIKLHGKQVALSNTSYFCIRSGLYDGYFTKALSSRGSTGTHTSAIQIALLNSGKKKKSYPWEGLLTEMVEIYLSMAHKAELPPTGYSHGCTK